MSKRPRFTRKKSIRLRSETGQKRGRPANPGAIQKARAERLAKIEKSYPVELMLTDFAIGHPDRTVRQYLVEDKGYSQKEYVDIIKKVPAADWYQARRETLDKITENLVKRQIDWAAEMHDLHFQSSKVGLLSAVEWLEYQKSLPIKDRDIRMLKVAMETIQLAQKIQRTALGLPTDDGAIHIYNKLVMNNDKHVQEMEKTPVEKLEETLTYEEIQELIELRREEKKSERLRQMENTIEML